MPSGKNLFSQNMILGLHPFPLPLFSYSMNEEKNLKLLAKAKACDIDVCFASDFYGKRLGALRLMAVGDWLYWDREEFNHRSFHAEARLVGIRIATKRCKEAAAYVIMRIS